MSRIAMLGAGTMGHALALVFALGGHAVSLTDNDAGALGRAGSLMEQALTTLRDAGLVDASWQAGRLHQAVRRVPDLKAALADADIIVEAISEQPEAKRALYATIDRLAPPQVILASNTSYLDVFPLIPQGRLRRALITHWYTPPYLVDLVDVVGSPETDPAVVEEMRALVAAMGKVPVVMRRFIPGYIANRIQSAMSLEVNRLLDEGYASAREIDDAVIHGLALRLPILGVLAKADFTGLSLLADALGNSPYEPPPGGKRSTTLDGLVAQGRDGVLSGRGYFDWNENPATLFAERDRRLIALKQALKTIGGPIRPKDQA
ncbi:MAG: 3-hydroxyacyl-CoA dehydrogenase family protein [Acetobacteraceae bacterium]